MAANKQYARTMRDYDKYLLLYYNFIVIVITCLGIMKAYLTCAAEAQ